MSYALSDHHSPVEQARHGYRARHVDGGAQDDEARRLLVEGGHDDPRHVPAHLGRKAPHSGHNQAETDVDRQTALHAHHSRKRQLHEASRHPSGRG